MADERFAPKVTPQTADELADLGYDIPSSMITDREPDAGDLLVCARVEESMGSPDNIGAVCADCGTAIVHRPHAPPAARKVCMPCARDRMAGGAA